MSNKTLHVNNFLTWAATRFTWLNLLGTWTKAKVTWENNGGTWRAIQAALSVTCPSLSKISSGASASGSVQSNNAAPVVTDNAAANTLTYSWTHLSTSSGNTPTVSNASIATPTFQATVTDGTDSVSSWRLTVTDATANAAATVTVSVTLTWINTS